ncbi:MAG: hypothetical protein ACXACF_00270 [Candidatus Hermodarchaeia archaeon]
MVSITIRRYIPLGIIWLVTIIALVDFFTGSLSSIVGSLTSWGTIVGAGLIVTASVSFIIRGVYGIMAWRRGSAEEKKKFYAYETAYAIALYVILFLIYIFQGSASEWFVFTIVRVLIPSWMAGIAYTASFIAIGIAYHWGVRSVETALFAFSTCIALLARAPITGAIFPPLLDLGNWMELFLWSPVARTFTIMAGLGALTMLMNMLRGKSAGFD